MVFPGRVVVWAVLVSGALIVWSVAAMAPDEQWIKTYQPLLTGFLALGGAVLAYAGIKQQIGEAKAEEDRRRQRENLAARAVLPVALSSLSDYSVTSIARLEDLLPEEIDRQAVENRLTDVPVIPDSVIDAFRDAIRHASASNAKVLADLLTGLQIQHSRLRGIKHSQAQNGRLTSREICDRIVDAAELYAGVNACYAYARRQDEAFDLASISSDQVRSALVESALFDDPRLTDLISHWKFEHSIFRLSKTED